MFGPVWVTTPERLKSSKLMNERNDSLNIEDDKAIWSNLLTSENHINHINLGWLMVEGTADSFNLNDSHIPDQIKGRIVVVSERLFTHIVNSNLEVRTSVSINPDTGAAEEGALFTYEAIPRATILWTEIVVSDYRGEFPSKERLQEWEELLNNNERNDKMREWINAEKREDNSSIWRWDSNTMQNVDHSISGIVEAGLQWAEHLGIGGMGTRGFGRIRYLGDLSKSTTTKK